jgi:diguanylate cyclase (GGDEF)-like protein
MIEDQPNGRPSALPHPRAIGWMGTAALAMGGSNQSLFLIAALFAGQGDIVGQGSAAVPLLIVGLLVSYAAMPGWLELVMMYPNKVGGIAAVCTEAFRPYSPMLSALAGVCYWWGWVPTCGVTALLSGAAIQQWCLPGVPVWVIGCTLVGLCCAINLAGIRWVTRIAVPVAILSATLAMVSMLAPILSGHVDWHRAMDFHLTTPFRGQFGALTAIMAGLYLIGFGAPAFEAATCYVGETKSWRRNVPRAVFVAAGMAAIYFMVLPVVWLGAIGPNALGQDLGHVLGPTFAPLFGSLAKSAAIGFMIFNMFHGTMQPLAGAARTLAQLSEDGVLPRCLAWRLPSDAPWVATVLTAVLSVLFLLIGDPIWLIAAANFTYLIGICMPSIAVWLLRRDAPAAERPWRAPPGSIGMGVAAAGLWGVSALLGFQQFGLPTVVIGLLFAYSGCALYAWRMIEDHRGGSRRDLLSSLHFKLTGAMLLVLGLDAAGYILAVSRITNTHTRDIAVLADIFVAVAALTITVGIVLPGMIAHTVQDVSASARRLAGGTIRDFAHAMDALGRGDLDQAHAAFDIIPVAARSNDELGAMARSFNLLQQEVKRAALGLDKARDGLRAARSQLLVANTSLQDTVAEQQRLAAQLRQAKEVAQFEATHDSLTGLPNRTLFLDCMEEALARHRIDARQDFSVLFIDLDRFKIVNDSLGHLAGNALLKEVARRVEALIDLRAQARTAPETVSHHDMVARLSGDEFAVLLARITTEEDASNFAERLQKALSAPFYIEADVVYVSASIGVVQSIAGYVSTETVLRDADIAMYRAKSLGKARAVVYEPSMHLRAQTQLHIESDLRSALSHGEFELYYQPIVSIQTHMVTGCEALVRWRKPGVGLIGPNEFISVAEETGLIVPLGAWIFREACTTARRWHLDMPERVPLNVAINLSARQFVQAELSRRVRDTVVDSGIDPATVTIEITESCTMGDPERAIRVLRLLKSVGVKLSVDDFGTGYSSLSYLHRFPIDKLKIDRSFVSNLGSSPESQKVVAAILALAQSLGIVTVAEGVETVAQLDFLARLGCDYAQGYLFAKPLAASEVEALIRRPVPFPHLDRVPIAVASSD